MQTDVRDQPGLLGESFLTMGAFEGLLACVEPTVGLQVRGAAEGLATLWAFKRSVPTVDHLVRHQVGRLMEVLAADVAPVLSLLTMRGKVKGQMGRGYEGFGAHRAAVRVRADAPVWSPAISGNKTGLTGWAFGRALCFGQTPLPRED